MQTDTHTFVQPHVQTHYQTHYVSRLELTGFRNHSHTQLQVGGRSVVLHGENGAGKTNILEALSLLAPGRGFRRARLADMDGAMPWTIFSEVSGAMGQVSIGTARSVGHAVALSEVTQGEVGGSSEPSAEPADKRIVRVDGQPLKSANQLSEYLSILWLTPQSDQLFMEGGTVRRKFLDRLVYGFDPAHARRVNRYEQAMRERNRLLCTYGAQAAWFDGVEAQMAEVGTAIAFARQQAVEHINAVMQMSDLSFPKARLDLNGVIEQAVQQGLPAMEVESLYRDKLADCRAGDQPSGRSSVGVHRAEFTVMHLGKHTEAARCSTGEQKALLLAIILAEARASALWHGRVPILLLDEVAAHLDPQKRTELYQEIQALKAQAWMSGVSDDLFKEMLGNVVVFKVEKGTILEG